MKHSPRHLIAAAVLAAVGVVACAQTPAPPQGDAPRMEGRQGFDPARMQQRMQARMAQRMAKLKDTLQIAPAQEGAWNAWAAAMQPPANWKRPDRAELERLPTPERIDRMRAIRSERNAMMDRRAEATKAFYAGLNPIQKRVFDLATARGMGRRGGGERDGGGYRRHHWG
jgi:periplasmic protein CpxP/Spy